MEDVRELIARARENFKLNKKEKEFLEVASVAESLSKGQMNWLQRLADRGSDMTFKASGAYTCKGCGRDISGMGEAKACGGRPISSDGMAEYFTLAQEGPHRYYLCVNCWDVHTGRKPNAACSQFGRDVFSEEGRS